MPKIKSFCELSRRQKNRRLHQYFKAFAEETKSNNNIVPSAMPAVEKSDDIANNNLTSLIRSDEVLLNTFKNIFSAEEIEQAFVETSYFNCNVDESHQNYNNTIDFLSTLPAVTPTLTLNSKLILWADENKVDLKSLSSLLKILKEEGHKDLPKDGRTLLKTPRSTVTHKRSGGDYYHYGLEKGIIDSLNQLQSIEIIGNIIVINVNIDGLGITRSRNSQLWPILVQVKHKNLKKPSNHHLLLR